LKNLTLSILLLSFFISSCQKEVIELAAPPAAPAETTTCIEQKDNPSGRTYPTDSLVQYNCTDKHCGFISLSKKNYWVYQDSIFNDGFFVRVQMDTLRFDKTYKSVTDGLTWWKANMDIGLPRLLYANDSTFFSAEQSLFAPELTGTRKDYSLFAGDSIRYLGSFDDIMAHCRSVKMKDPIKILAGTFSNYILFEKNAMFFGNDKLYYKPGIGVLKYVQMRAPIGSPDLQLQKICTLVAYHLE
jgi:hypothetical protein